MPEATNVKTTIHGPANRVPIFNRECAGEGTDSGEENGSNDEDCTNPPPAANSSGDAHPAAEKEDAKVAPAEELNEHETIVAVDPESLPNTVRLFEALQTNLDHLSTQAAIFAQAQVKASMGENVAEAVAQKTAVKELVSFIIAVSWQKSQGNEEE